MSLKYLSSTFGMSEMECAAEQIVDKAIVVGNWNIHVTYDEMEAKAGFLQLLVRQWLTPYLFSKVSFGVTAEFIERVTPKYKDLVANLEHLDGVIGWPKLDGQS